MPKEKPQPAIPAKYADLDPEVARAQVAEDAFLDSPVTAQTLLAVAAKVVQEIKDLDSPLTNRKLTEVAAHIVREIKGVYDEAGADYERIFEIDLLEKKSGVAPKDRAVG
jgi:hypothetical protein